MFTNNITSSETVNVVLSYFIAVSAQSFHYQLLQHWDLTFF